MIKTSFKAASVLAPLALAFLSACSTTAPKSSGSVRIHSLEGTSQIARAGGNWELAHLWQTVRAGDRARTSANAKIDFSLGKYGGVLTLMPDSALDFEQLGPIGTDSQIVAVLNLVEGRVVGDTLKLPPNTRIQIKTRAGVHELP